jgi:hypothetical protein
VVGRDISDASTWFSALTSITNIPIVSMTWLEGRMFGHFGVHGLLWTDAAGNLLVFAIVVGFFLTRRSSSLSIPVATLEGDHID